MQFRNNNAHASLTVAFVSFLILLILTSVACTKKEDSIVDSGRANVLILALDACRPDKLGAYGYDKQTSPAIDSVAADPDAVIFHNHIVQGTWTKPSTASLFTGLFVYQHGVTAGHEQQPKKGEQFFLTQVLPDEHTTLAEEFREVGYFTFGAVKSYHLIPEYGFSQGFDRYTSPQETRGDGALLIAATEWMSSVRRPFFGYIHLNACHHPYPDRDSAFFKSNYSGKYDEASRQKAGIDFTTSDIKKKINEEGLSLSQDDVTFLNLIYDSKLSEVNRQLVDPLLVWLKREGFYDNMLLIITADHGEELFEHGGYAHGHALWNEVIRVPLIVKYPHGKKPPGLHKEIHHVTQSVDLYPSLVSFLNRPVRANLAGKKSLFGEFGKFAFSETESEWALIKDSQKYIESSDGPLLFDINSDRKETRNLAADMQHEINEMKNVYALLRRNFPIAAKASTVERELDKKEIEALRSLGYMQ
jgi:arylsulfatase A-like enzyme